MRAVLICIDKPGSLDLRLANRPAHVEYLKASPCVELAGPFLEGETMVGSMLVLNVESLAEAQAWAANDPYAKAGLFASVEIREWKKVIG
ncbi:YciI family protein [Stagnihabitans tardus]|uniref:YciI family protein n=1 Tax=Stagnihabitans tardus TaxID=2699202 RepID=A0AAE4Y6F5_9RHOB|nr:YciI family protein [Stagnihabitans tardus]NBZ86712.1 YciI family protein [Stagnihabitans tardus]